MNCPTGDFIKDLWELMALSTAYAIFTSKMHTSGLFSTCAQQGSMLTLASLSRVPISTDTLGTVMCWFFLILFRASLQGVPMQDFKRAHCSFFGLWDGEKNLEKGLWCPRSGLVGMGFFSFSSLFSGIPEFQFCKNSWSQILSVIETFDCLICPSVRPNAQYFTIPQEPQSWLVP